MAHYNIVLVIISYIVAVMGSLMALIITRFAQESPEHSGGLIFLGALCLGGVGIWSMHFIGMIAFSMPNMATSYEFGLTVLSMLIGIGVVYIGLKIIVASFTFARLISSGLFVGLGVAAMHYTGILAMQMQADIHWDWSIIMASVVIAIIAAIVALWLLVHVKVLWQVIISALVMGVAVCGMHYTGMMAADFVYNPNLPIAQPTEISHFMIIISAVDLIILVVSLMVTMSLNRLRPLV